MLYCSALCCTYLQLREELSNARGINDLTADETTKLLLENSHLQQVKGYSLCARGRRGGGEGIDLPARTTAAPIIRQSTLCSIYTCQCAVVQTNRVRTSLPHLAAVQVCKAGKPGGCWPVRDLKNPVMSMQHMELQGSYRLTPAQPSGSANQTMRGTAAWNACRQSPDRRCCSVNCLCCGRMHQLCHAL